MKTLTHKEIAEAVNISHHTLESWLKDGKFGPATPREPGRRRVWTEDDINELRKFVATRRRRPRKSIPQRFASPLHAEAYAIVRDYLAYDVAARAGHSPITVRSLNRGHDMLVLTMDSILQACGYKLTIVKMEK